MTAPTRIGEELAGFLESGLAIVMASRDGDLQADGAVAWAARIHESREQLTLFLHEQAAAEMLPNLEKHPEMAINFDKPTLHKACQVKGRYLSSRPARADERAIVDRQVEGFAGELVAIGIPREATAAWVTWPCVAFEMTVLQLFEQTPGPGSGEPLK